MLRGQKTQKRDDKDKSETKKAYLKKEIIHRGIGFLRMLADEGVPLGSSQAVGGERSCKFNGCKPYDGLLSSMGVILGNGP